MTRFYFGLDIMHMKHTLGLIVVFMMSFAGVAKADSYNLGYDIYAGGFEAVHANYFLSETDKKNMKVEVRAETDGFIGRLFPWQGQYITIGQFEGERFIPAKHTSTSVWRDNPKQKELVFENGEIKSYIERYKDAEREKDDLKPNLVENAVDMLSAVMIAIKQVENTGQCNTAATAFDGKRKFNIQLTNSVPDTISSPEYSVYNGPALKCTLSVLPLEGFSKDDQNKGWLAIQNHTAERGKLPEIWFAPLKDNGPLLPVRMEIASSYGSVVAHLTDIDITEK